MTSIPRLKSSALRNLILACSRKAHTGHIGSCLSIVELIVALYTRVLRRHEDKTLRDQFVLSKGHAALALYAALYLDGVLSEQELSTYCKDLTLLGVHPTSQLTGVEFSSGSLGQGLSMAVGAALAARLSEKDQNIFVLLSDAECQEGSVWEAAMFAGHHRLTNLFALIDCNGQQAMGATSGILDQSRLEERWLSMGWDVVRCDGHDVEAVSSALLRPATGGAPRVVVADTISGKGVSFMEGLVKWHYWPMSDDEFTLARAEQGTEICGKYS